MKQIEITVTESGQYLMNPGDGFIIHGALLKGDNYSKLLGGNNEIDTLISNGMKGSAFTTLEFLELLDLPIEAFQNYIDQHTPKIK